MTDSRTWDSNATYVLTLMIAALLIHTLLATDAAASDYGDRVAQLPLHTAKRLAEANTPTRSGAMGRNKQAYFHVRFQRGMHHVADYGLVTRRRDVVQRFLTAVDYSLQHQLPSGDFELVIPESLRNLGRPGIADRASGVAFFASSLGLGIYGLQTNDWFQESSDCAPLRRHLATITPQLRVTLTYLMEHQQSLEAADKHAPNRLLFDALAFATLGKILGDKDALDVASSFVAKAIEQVDEEQGYFIEGGGFDSSYNAVATALALRLLMMEHHGPDLRPICENAIRWQKGRISDSGEVSTAGNARVRPGQAGESFLGREKDVDVGHVVEALMLASQALADTTSHPLALKVVGFYERQRNRSR